MLPNVIIGIGQAGKELTFQLFEQEWIIERLLNKEKGIEYVKPVIIDTATGEAPDDLDKIAKIENNIKQHSKNISKPYDIKIDYHCIPWEIQISNPSELRDVTIINNIKEKMDIDVWWIEDKKVGLNEWFKTLKEFSPSIENDFRGGTYRNRAITKAVFYKAISEGSISLDYPGDDAAIIVGLGGGTGSGIFIDVAKMLKKEGFNISLFAVLPTSYETDVCKANAFAALSELEYLNLQKESPFSSIVLLPIEETRYSTASTDILEDFDEAFPYLFTNFYHPQHKVKDTIAREYYGSYTGFINATTFSIKYDIENLLIFKNLLEEGMDFLKDYREEELTYRNRVNKFFDTVEDLVPRNEEAILATKDIEYLHKKIESISIWNEKVFEIVGVKVVKKIKDEINYHFKQQKININEWPMNLTELERRSKIIITLIQKVEAVDHEEKKVRDEILRNFQVFNIIIDHVRKSMELKFDDETEKIIGELVKSEEINPDNTLYLKHEMEITKSKIKKTIDEHQEVKENILKIEDDLNVSKKDLKSALEYIENDISEILRLRKFIGINEIYNNLLDELNKASVEKVKTENDWISKFNSLLEKFPDDLTKFLEDLLTYMYYCKREVYFKNKADEKSLRNRLRRGRRRMLLEEVEKYKDKKLSQHRAIRAHYPKWKISFNITTDELLTTDFNPEEIINEKYNTLFTKINKYFSNYEFIINVSKIINIDVVEKKYSETDEIYAKDDILKNFKNLIESNISDQFENDLKEATVLEGELIEKISELQKKQQYLSQIQTLHDESIPFIRSINNRWNDFLEKFLNINEQIEQHIGSTEVAGFKCTIYPDPSTIKSIDENINVILDSDVDTKNMMISYYQQYIQNIITGTYTGLSYTKPKYFCEEGEKYWRIKKAIIVVNTCDVIKYLLSGSKDEKELQRMVAQRLGIEKNKDVEFIYVNDGNDWVTSATLFISPIFIDQLYSIKEYFKNYERLKEKNGKQNILPHTLMLEEGRIIRRNKVVEESDSACYACETWESDKDVSNQIIKNIYEPKDFINCKEIT